MENNKEIISDLNSLITILNDGKQGYESAAETTDSLELKAVFGKYALERAAYATELKAHIKQHGGNEDDNENGGVLGAIHRGWLDVKHAVTGLMDFGLIKTVSAVKKQVNYKTLGARFGLRQQTKPESVLCNCLL
ncbi:MAG: PA2169 family four-helix-bundle protein [Sphingobacteriaceae bacterium]|nr:MAG: PA2169 family four-helix-bundle protein [Sphingobacteriaceae bacterium]